MKCPNPECEFDFLVEVVEQMMECPYCATCVYPKAVEVKVKPKKK